MSNLLDLNSLRLEIIVQTLKTSLSAISRLFDSSEGSVYSREIPIVHGDRSSFDLAGNAERSADGPGVNACCEGDQPSKLIFESGNGRLTYQTDQK